MRRLWPLIAVGVAVAAICPTAAAQESNPVDPDSPAGTEYQLPLERARSEANGRGDPEPGAARATPAGSAEAPPLFGAGVKPKGGQAAPKGGGSAKGEERAGSPSAAEAGEQMRAAAFATDGAQGSAWRRSIAIVVGILLVGGSLGFVLKRSNAARGD